MKLATASSFLLVIGATAPGVPMTHAIPTLFGSGHSEAGGTVKSTLAERTNAINSVHPLYNESRDKPAASAPADGEKYPSNPFLGMWFSSSDTSSFLRKQHPNVAVATSNNVNVEHHAAPAIDHRADNNAAFPAVEEETIGRDETSKVVATDHSLHATRGAAPLVNPRVDDDAASDEEDRTINRPSDSEATATNRLGAPRSFTGGTDDDTRADGVDINLEDTAPANTNRGMGMMDDTPKVPRAFEDGMDPKASHEGSAGSTWLKEGEGGMMVITQVPRAVADGMGLEAGAAIHPTQDTELPQAVAEAGVALVDPRADNNAAFPDDEKETIGGDETSKIAATDHQLHTRVATSVVSPRVDNDAASSFVNENEEDRTINRLSDSEAATTNRLGAPRSFTGGIDDDTRADGVDINLEDGAPANANRGMMDAASTKIVDNKAAASTSYIDGSNDATALHSVNKRTETKASIHIQANIVPAANEVFDIEAAIQATTSTFDRADTKSQADPEANVNDTFVAFKARMLKKNPTINDRTLTNCWNGNPSAAWHPNYSAGWTQGHCRYTTDCNSPSYSSELACCKTAYVFRGSLCNHSSPRNY